MPVSASTPAKAMIPTQTATLRLYGLTWKRSRMFTPKTEKSRNHGCEYNQIIRNPPDHATKIPEKTFKEVGIE